MPCYYGIGEGECRGTGSAAVIHIEPSAAGCEPELRGWSNGHVLRE